MINQTSHMEQLKTLDRIFKIPVRSHQSWEGSKNLRGHDPRQKNRSEPAFGPAFLLERFLVSKAAALRAWKPRNWGWGGQQKVTVRSHWDMLGGSLSGLTVSRSWVGETDPSKEEKPWTKAWAVGSTMSGTQPGSKGKPDTDQPGQSLGSAAAWTWMVSPFFSSLQEAQAKSTERKIRLSRASKYLWCLSNNVWYLRKIT